MSPYAYGKLFTTNETLGLTEGKVYLLQYIEGDIVQVENDRGDYVIAFDAWFDFDYEEEEDEYEFTFEDPKAKGLRPPVDENERSGNMFRVIIAGGRDMNDYALVEQEADKLLGNMVARGEQIVIISGNARGADRMGELYAEARGYECRTYPADWDAHGKSAGYKRNQLMAENADALIAFYDGKSKGTGHMINIAKTKGLPTRIVSY